MQKTIYSIPALRRSWRPWSGLSVFQQRHRKGLAYKRSMPAGKISGWTGILGGD